MPPEKNKTDCDYSEIPMRCPAHSGVEKDHKNMKTVVHCMKANNKDDHERIWTHVGKTVTSRMFWIVVILFVGIVGCIFGFITLSQRQYQCDHAELHRDINNEIKHMNEGLGEKMQKISEDVQVIKSKITNGGG
jgi:hypothetical protein